MTTKELLRRMVDAMTGEADRALDPAGVIALGSSAPQGSPSAAGPFASGGRALSPRTSELLADGTGR